MNDIKFKKAEKTISTTEERDFRGMCLNEARRQAGLNDFVRQGNMCDDASNGDSGGRHSGFFWRPRRERKDITYRVFGNSCPAVNSGVLK